MASVDKNRPTREWIESVRKRYPCETEMDRVLTRKQHRRAGPPYQPVSLETLINGTAALLRCKLQDAFEITDARWLAGGASKLQMAFCLKWNQPGAGRTATPMVLRMEPSESITETSRLREFQVIKAVDGLLPVPPTYWHDADGEFLPYPAIIYGFAEGVTKPTESSSGVTGVGTKMPAAVRQALGVQYVEHLARLHTFDWRQADLGAFDKPTPGIQAVTWKLNQWERILEEDINEDVPLMRLAMAWLRANMPPVERVVLVHGDYRVGNFLYTEHNNRISSWLDWELAYLGDYHNDVAWTAKGIFGHAAEDGKTFLVGGFMPIKEFHAAYEKASGLPVIPERLTYYDILGSYQIATTALATGSRIARNGKTHQDVLVAWLSGISYPIMEDLRVKLEAVL
ncbi:MAG: phosphotransferase family protein [Rhodocyclaceae bacterium]|nr:phosphotransferase family protein [Rhodocyclaceae bacterium]